jgi:hypothetical protein
MKSANQKTNAAKILTKIEKDLAAARREGRFEDALLDLQEIFVMYGFTESEAVKARCAALLSAPEMLPKAA